MTTRDVVREPSEATSHTGEPRLSGTHKDDEMREFLLVLRQALLMIVRWIENRYGLGSK